MSGIHFIAHSCIKQNGSSGVGDTRGHPSCVRLDCRHRILRFAHVEGHGFHRCEHRNGADHMGGNLDELCGAKHWPDAVQNLRLHAGSQLRSTGG